MAKNNLKKKKLYMVKLKGNRIKKICCEIQVNKKKVKIYTGDPEKQESE